MFFLDDFQEINETHRAGYVYASERDSSGKGHAWLSLSHHLLSITTSGSPWIWGHRKDKDKRSDYKEMLWSCASLSFSRGSWSTLLWQCLRRSMKGTTRSTKQGLEGSACSLWERYVALVYSYKIVRQCMPLLHECSSLITLWTLWKYIGVKN